MLEYAKVLDLLAQFAVSEAGKEACASLSPLPSVLEIETAAERYRQALQWRTETRFRLSDFPSLEGLFTFIQEKHGIIESDGLFAMRSVLHSVRDLRDSFSEHKDIVKERWKLLEEEALSFPMPQKTMSGLDRCLSDDGRIKDSASPELLSIRRDIRNIHRRCTKKVKEFVQDHGLTQYLQDDYITISSDRYVLPLKTNFKGKFPGIIHDYSQTGETCYFEPMFLVETNNDLQELKHDEREAEKEILIMLTGLVRSEFESLGKAYRLLVDTDVLTAKLEFAEKSGSVPLEFSHDAPLRLLKARHPLLVFDKNKDAVPIDIELNQAQRGLIISGGNAGGKTVCLKTLGLIALMGMAGLPVPAAEGSSLPYWLKIFVFLGDEQSLEDHVSTFTAQITRLSRTWQEIDDKSLIILDEFGAGTDPSQGAALAQAVVDKIIEKGAFVAAATHFPALKIYAVGKENVRAASVLFDPDTKKALYSLGYDQVGASRALDVARENGLPDEILTRAEEYLLVDSSESGGIIDRLNALAVEREKALEDVRKEEDKYKKKRDKLQERFERERFSLLAELKKEAQEIVNQWQSDKIGRKKALKELAEKRKALESETVEQRRSDPVDIHALEPGDVVRYLPWGKEGSVEEVDAKKKKVKVNLGGVGMWVDAVDVTPEQQAAAPGKASVSGTVERSKGLKLDLRGYRADTAISELSSFLDKALLSDYDEVEVIHGKGSGALRSEVHKFLEHFPAVDSFSLADEEHGGDGMTLVALK